MKERSLPKKPFLDPQAHAPRLAAKWHKMRRRDISARHTLRCKRYRLIPWVQTYSKPPYEVPLPRIAANSF